MSVSIQSLGIDRLGIDERLELVEEILSSLADRAGTYPLSDSQKTELDQRIAAYEQHPENVIPLSEVLASVTRRFKG